MKLSKNNKMYAAILGLGVLALGVDRFVLGGGPADAMADMPAIAPAKTLPNVASPAASTSLPAGRVLNVAAQLEAVASGTMLPPRQDDRDAFGTPPALAAAIDAELARQEAARARSAQEKEAEELVKSLRLTAVRIPRDGTPVALINGRQCPLGEAIFGTAFRVVEITAQHATLEGSAEGPRITLKLHPDNSK